MQQTTQGYPAMAAMPVQMPPIMAMPVTPVMTMPVAQTAAFVAVPAQFRQPVQVVQVAQQPTAAPPRPPNAASQALVAGPGAPAVKRETQTRAAMYWQMMTGKGNTENPLPPSAMQAETQRQPSVQEMKQRSAQELERLKSNFQGAPAPAQPPATLLAMPGQQPANRPSAQYQSAARTMPPMQDADGHQLVEVRRLDGSVQVMSQREAMQLVAARGNRLVASSTTAGPPANEQFGPQSQRPAVGSALPMSRLHTSSAVPMTQPTAGGATPQGQGRAVQYNYTPPQGQPDQQVYQTPQQQDGRNPYNFLQFGSSFPQYSSVSHPVAPSDWEADGPYQPPPGTPEARNYNGYASPQVQQPTVQPGTLYATQSKPPSSRPSSTIDGNVFGYDGQLAYQVPQEMQYVPQEMQYVPQYAPQNSTLNPTPGSSAPMPAPMHPNSTSPLKGSALPTMAPSGPFQYAAMQPAMPAPAPYSPYSPYVSQQQPVHMPPQQQQQAPYMMVPTNMHMVPEPQQQQQAVPHPQQSAQQNQQWLNEGIEM